MRLATFNTFWFGTTEAGLIRRRDEDRAAMAALLARLDADVLVLQEVVSLPELEALLSAVRPGGYALKDGDGNWLTTGRMRSRISHLQKIALAWDPRTVELLDAPRPFERRWPGPRAPIVARVRARGGARPLEVTVVGVHLKSGGLALLPDSPPAQVRAAECEVLCDWLLGASDRGRPQTEAVVALGDWNATADHPSLSPLRARLAGWTLQAPRFSPDLPGEHWSSFGQRSVLDHALTSPAATARLTATPLVLAFDIDPAFHRPPSPSPVAIEEHYLRRITDLVIEPDHDLPPIPVENLYRISDHRPLCLELL